MPRTRSTPAAAFATRPPSGPRRRGTGRGRGADASRGVEFDLQPDGSLSLGLEGGHSARRIVHAGGAETGRALTSRLAELVAEHERIEVLEGASALALWSDGRRCDGVLTDRGAVRRRSDGPGDRRRGRALGADDEPARRDRRRSGARPRRRRRPRRPRALPVPPDGARAARRRARRLADHRGGPRRGGAAARRRRPPVHRRARAARSGHRGDPRPDGRRRDRRGRPRPAAGTDGAIPDDHPNAASRSASTRDRAGAGRPRPRIT